MIPWIFGSDIVTYHHITSLVGAIFFVGMGVFLLILWVPTYKVAPKVTKEAIVEAWQLILTGVFVLVFGMYALIVIGIVGVCYALYMIGKSILIMLDRDTKD